MLVSGEIPEIRTAVAAARQQGCRIGCVPTMGALHAGHVSLIEECRQRVDFVLVTIFVNPTQFAPHEDLDKYPRPLEADLTACREAGAAAVFTPEIAALYPPEYQTWVEVDKLTTILEGACRPAHFRGVTTIVAKLFNIVQPDLACFGEKDYQQQTVIRRMVADLNIPIEIVVCPTLRDPDGLALSSRNQYLSPAERQSALALSQALQQADAALTRGEQNLSLVERQMWEFLEAHPGVQPEYAVLRDPDSLQPLPAPQLDMIALIAAKVGETRLIDNRRIRLP